MLRLFTKIHMSRREGPQSALTTTLWVATASAGSSYSLSHVTGMLASLLSSSQGLYAKILMNNSGFISEPTALLIGEDVLPSKLPVAYQLILHSSWEEVFLI